MQKNLEVVIKKVLDNEVGFLIEVDRERLAKAIAKALQERFYTISYSSQKTFE
jgi:hypothetical protein